MWKHIRDEAGRKGFAAGPDDVRPLQFLTPKMAMHLTKGGHCPCHDDPRHLFSQGWPEAGNDGRGLRSVQPHQGGPSGASRPLPQARLPAGADEASAAPADQAPSTNVTTSVAFRACTPSERRMHELIATGRADLQRLRGGGHIPSAISVGLRALQALGLTGVTRSPR